MNASGVAEPAIGPDLAAGDTYLPLLRSAQAYLHSLLERRAPGSALTAAWQQFYRIYNELIRRFVIAQGIRDADVDDCVQDVWSEVAARLVEFRHPGNRPGLRAWLYTLARSKATDLVRQKARHNGKRLSETSEPADDEPDPAEAHQQQWDRALAKTLLAGLCNEVSQLNSRLLRMRLIEGRSVGEVAAALDLAPAQVRYRQHRMLRKLRARMAVYSGNHFGRGG